MNTLENICSYYEACQHLEAAWSATDGKQWGGTYAIVFESGDIAEVELSIQNGLARPVWDA